MFVHCKAFTACANISQHSSLLGAFVNYGRKSFTTLDTGDTGASMMRENSGRNGKTLLMVSWLTLFLEGKHKLFLIGQTSANWTKPGLSFQL
jgi:hypothetical protein